VIVKRYWVAQKFSQHHMKYIAKIVLLCVSATAGWAVDPAPLPKVVTEAKKVMIIDRTGNTTLYDNVYDKLRKWNHWTLVQEQEEADLLVVLAKDTITAGTVTYGQSTASGQATTYGKSTIVNAQASGVSSTSPMVVSMPRYLVLVDNRRSQIALSVSCEQRISSGYTAKVLVDRLRKGFPKDQR